MQEVHCLRLSELVELLDEKRVTGEGDPEITGLSYDSRKVRPGQAFFCIQGLITDGHLHVNQALDAGAASVFIEKLPEADIEGSVPVVKVPDTRRALALCSSRYYGDPSSGMKLVGITGTNGKTTTAFLVESICRSAGMTTGLVGTIQCMVAGVAEPVERTTPESLDLQELLRRMADAGVEVVAMEVSSHALELHRVAGCRFDVVVFTNLTQDHLDFHLSLENYFGAKRKLFQSGDYGEGRKGVINVDDPFGRRLLEETDLDATGFGFSPGADLRGVDLEVSPSGTSFTLEYGGRAMVMDTPLKGKFNASNCLAATTACLELGIDPGTIASGVSRVEGVPGRFESIDCGQDFTVIVDYAHTPDGIRSLMQACNEIARGRVYLVVGCGGDRDRSKRPVMGRVAVEMSDCCILTSDNPRGEDPAGIIEMMLSGIPGDVPGDRYRVEVDRAGAIATAIGMARKGDMVVIAGKGHESGQVFKGRVVPFDDREVARKSLAEVPDERRQA